MLMTMYCARVVPQLIYRVRKQSNSIVRQLAARGIVPHHDFDPLIRRQRFSEKIYFVSMFHAYLLTYMRQTSHL